MIVIPRVGGLYLKTTWQLTSRENPLSVFNGLRILKAARFTPTFFFFFCLTECVDPKRLRNIFMIGFFFKTRKFLKLNVYCRKKQASVGHETYQTRSITALYQFKTPSLIFSEKLQRSFKNTTMNVINLLLVKYQR